MNIGKFKAYYQRIALYITGVNFFMIFYNFIQTNKWFTWYVWIIIISVIVFGLSFFDRRFVWEDEQRITAEKNPILMEIQRDVKELKKRL